MSLRPLVLSVASAACLTAASAQVRDADLQQQALRMPQSRPGLPLTIRPEPPGTPADPRVANLRFTLATVRIEGTRGLDGRTVALALGEVAGESFDLAGLRELAVRIQELARGAGFPDARVHMPPQNLAGGILRVVVDEGGAAQAQAPTRPRPADPGITNLQVILSGVRVEGASHIAAAASTEMAAAAGRSYDIAGLRTLATQVQDKARSLGYSFARAYLPPQDLAGGILRIVVDEGRFGQVQAIGPTATKVQPWLAPLQQGRPIHQETLERTLMLLEQLPGVEVQATLGPGADPGTGDLQVQAQARATASGEVGLDNHGNRHTGVERLRTRMEVGSALVFGDKLSLGANVSRMGTWLGSLSYSVPVGTQGLRTGLSASRSEYQLGEEFESLMAHGTSDTLSATLSYPLVLKLGTNVNLSAAIQRRNLRDQFDAVAVDQRKRIKGVPATLSADHRDARGVSWGSATLAIGQLSLDGSLEAQDQATAQTAGRFSKFSLDVARLHDVAKGWRLYGRLSGQRASKNLDSSEKLALGGPQGVRAWPSGEALGDDGWLGQLEVRYHMGAIEPYLFIDAGGVRINHSPWATSSNSRKLSGTGLGMRWTLKDWSLESSIAWRGGSGQSTSDPESHSPQGWVSLGWRF